MQPSVHQLSLIILMESQLNDATCLNNQKTISNLSHHRRDHHHVPGLSADMSSSQNFVFHWFEAHLLRYVSKDEAKNVFLHIIYKFYDKFCTPYLMKIEKVCYHLQYTAG